MRPLSNALISAALLASVAGFAAAPTASARQSGPAASADARSFATEAEVRDARRAYRAACQARSSVGFCECMTGAVVQELTPAEIRIAIAHHRGQTLRPPPPREARAHVETVEARYAQLCAAFR